MDDLQVPSLWPPDREEIPYSPPNNPYLDGKAPHQFHMNLGDAQLRQLMEDLWQEVSQREVNASPQEPILRLLDVSSRRWGPQCGWQGAHLHEREGMGTQRTATSTHWPPQPDKDVGHLINTLTTRLQLGTLRINTFSGKAMLGKTEVSFEQYYHEVQCVKDLYPETYH